MSQGMGFFDISAARLAHLRWEMQLEEMLKKNKVDIQLTTHANCTLGVWLYSTGLQKYSGIPEISQLETIHVAFHKTAAEVLDHIRAHRHEHADKAFSELQLLSREIIFLLTAIELKIMQRREMIDSLKHPLRTLKRFFS